MNGVQAAGMPRPSTGNDSAVALRLPETWLKRAEELRAYMSSLLGPGGEVTRSDVLRAAIARGLDVIEAERGKAKGGKGTKPRGKR